MSWNLSKDRPIYLQLVEQIKLQILSGTYASGEHFPSVRELATEAAVNPNTMQRALAQLESEQLVYSQRTAGRFVTGDSRVIEAAKRELALRHVERFLAAMCRLGMKREDVFILANGDIFEIARGKARISGFTNGAAVLIDGTTSIDDADNTVLRERKLLSDDGIVTIAMALKKGTGELAAQPEVDALGFLYASEFETVINACTRRAVDFVRRTKAANKNVADAVRSGQMQSQIRSLLYEKTKRRPVVMVSVIEVE